MAAYDGHATKRLRTDMDGHGVQQGGRDQFEDPHKPSPSPVVHVRGLSEAILESDLVDAVSQFGPVSYVMMMPRKRQALIEFEHIEGAKNCVDYTQNGPLIVCGSPAYFNFSTSQKIQRPPGDGGMGGPQKILLFTIINPQYPINVEVMNAICSPHGQVLRIVIFKKNGVQAMVEFADADAARAAQSALQGADIYSGCCTLKIEFAKVRQNRLNIYKNDTESWDYTNPNLGSEGPVKKPLLGDPHGGYGAPRPYEGGPPSGPRGRGGPPPHGGGYGGEEYHDNGYADGYGNGRPVYPPPAGRGYGGPGMTGGDPHYQGGPPHGRGGGRTGGYMGDAMGGGPGFGQGGNAVLMVYGLTMDQFNCAKMFNMFCLYGNVMRVKFLKSKEGSAMIQLGDAESAQRAMNNLNYANPFDSKVQISFSKQPFLQEVQNPYELRDGTPSYEDFGHSRNNRFATQQAAQKNRIQPPSPYLHYFNAPPNMSEEQIREMFETNGAKSPAKIKAFPAKSERSSTGLIEYNDKQDAMEALILINHVSVPNPSGKNPYVFKLCFSNAPIKEFGGPRE